MVNNQHQDQVMYTHVCFVVFCNHKNKHLEHSIKFKLNNTATCRLLLYRNEFIISETVEAALTKLFTAVKTGIITEDMCRTQQRPEHTR